RGLSISWAMLLLALAWRVSLGRFDRLLEEHTIFSGVTYTDAHVTLSGLLVFAGALVLGAVLALINAVAAPQLRWLLASGAPAALIYLAAAVLCAGTRA